MVEEAKMDPVSGGPSASDPRSAIEETFDSIYRSNHWGSAESVSGEGSTLAYTENLRRELPILFAKYDIKTVFDAPSGDFNWMSLVVGETDIEYLGGEIVRSLVDSNRRRSTKPNTRFEHFDITRDRFPDADLWICRDCLFHFSYEHIGRALALFAKSRIPYVLTTTHANTGFENHDIETGGFRLIDLFSAPFSFPVPMDQIEDWIPGFPRRLMCLWSRDQILRALQLSGLDA
ncbi:class I SAM-dependent methyltransferase [Novosphingobium sp.]|uniref:class I SAM-dependent methyltransferase n=1 Tax=Novosphingobium sp. TaxID=1874826 RepID=UPI0026329DEA|nr:class I SAM-dependent methyltransferase [Novosphingobium sp.]